MSASLPSSGEKLHSEYYGEDGLAHGCVSVITSVTYALAGCVIGCVVGLVLGRMLYNLLIDGCFPYAVWTIPVSRLLIVVAFVAAATLAAVYAPAKRMREMAVTETINEL